MDRLRQISAEIIRLYRKQLDVWVLGKIANLKDADLLQYDRRRDRIEELRKELESNGSGSLSRWPRFWNFLTSLLNKRTRKAKRRSVGA